MTKNAHNSMTRDGFIDFAKGICIFLVVWGHCIQYFSVGSFDFFEDIAFKIVYSFHMPLFMFLSGYVFYWSCSRRSLGTVIQKRLSGLMIPMLSWGGISFLITELSSARGVNISPLRVVFRAFWAGNIVLQAFFSVFNIWFLCAALEASIIVVCIYNLKLKKPIEVLALFAGLIALCFMPSIALSMFVYPYFVLGFLFCEHKILERSWFKYCVLVTVPLWGVMLLFFGREYYIYLTGVFPNEYTTTGIIYQLRIDCFRYLIGFFGTIAVFGILYYTYKEWKRTNFFDKVTRIGQHSLQIYLIQRVLLERFCASAFSKIVEKNGCNVLALNKTAYDFLFTPTLALVIVFLCCLISLAIKKVSLLNYCLFGRK